MPHQAGAEFQADGRDADSTNRAAYQKLKDELLKKRNEVEGAIGAFSRFDPWPQGSSMDEIGKFFERLTLEVETAVKQLPEALSVFKDVTDIFDGKVGKQPVDIEQRRKEALRRFDAKIPPGYKDKGRPGDYLIWAEMKDKAKSAQLPVLFVTDDNKEDWWARHDGKTLGPRPELRHEFFEATGQLFYAYSPSRFLAFVSSEDEELVSKETVKEMERVQETREIPRRSILFRHSEMLNLVTVLALHTAKSEDEIIKTAMKITKVSGRISEEQSLRRTGDGNLDDWEFNSLEEHLEKLSIEAQSIFQNKNKDDPEKINTWYAFSKLIDCFSYSEYWDQIPKLMDAIKSNRGINEVFRKKEG
ncbi:hypothetical protein EOA22_16835 [Mesorhizobium sp. M7A.F.Ca.US.014.04.1.1]|nr:hypothetical protein EN987_27340 [Mesorhizobium sp. M7A.F.Ca.CA.002.11.2.1]RUX56720.1 hypothetical protein EN994_08605 [Mesorhizobium sp. M7A.F.Ca.CA.002.09.1.1]RUX64450.1 hypothetical protein EOA22_16835 [Mesorhizobium sp. M7A.F.Ca.US.014.04.1.1]RUY38735.1 hypothetical protein EN972_23670 [Mesorhizobium sp. M7A.F.Ca.CA.002.07.1.1]RUZ29323.1 hypothetical protein EN949_04225 [Mesorhizobium sp. M7A.F.Ca.US.007.01.2.1]RUZ49162.1 hypothetical protein EN948_05790 [Mesorhizobium sp. M7A.F.Ca.US.0